MVKFSIKLCTQANMQRIIQTHIPLTPPLMRPRFCGHQWLSANCTAYPHLIHWLSSQSCWESPEGAVMMAHQEPQCPHLYGPVPSLHIKPSCQCKQPRHLQDTVTHWTSSGQDLQSPWTHHWIYSSRGCTQLEYWMLPNYWRGTWSAPLGPNQTQVWYSRQANFISSVNI